MCTVDQRALINLFLTTKGSIIISVDILKENRQPINTCKYFLMYVLFQYRPNILLFIISGQNFETLAMVIQQMNFLVPVLANMSFGFQSMSFAKSPV